MQQLPCSSPAAGIPVACGHTFDSGQLFPVRPSAVLAVGAGELVASARDVATLAVATVDGQLLSADSARQMLTLHARRWPDAWQGLGVRIEYHGSMRLAGHGRTLPGFDATAHACPETGESAAMLANTNTSLLTGQLRVALLGLPQSWAGSA
jgi:Beta-lactamase